MLCVYSQHACLVHFITNNFIVINYVFVYKILEYLIYLSFDADILRKALCPDMLNLSYDFRVGDKFSHVKWKQVKL